MGSPNEPLGKADYLLVECARVGGRHLHYDMPHVILEQRFVVVPIMVRVHRHRVSAATCS